MQYKNEQIKGQIDIFDILYLDRKLKREEEVKRNDITSNNADISFDINSDDDLDNSNGNTTKRRISESR